jgi:hypothetical protein
MLSASRGIRNTSPAPSLISNNLVYQSRISDIYDVAATATLTANITGRNPQFVDPTANDFHLLGISPAVNTGLFVPEVTSDYEDRVRPQGPAPDIGPFEYMQLL